MPCFSTIQWFVVGDERAQDRGGDVGVVPGAERVADVVEQRAGDVLVVLAGLEGERRREARVVQAIDREAAEVAVEQLQVREHPRARGRCAR